MVADSHHFDEEQDPDPDPHLREKLDLDSSQNRIPIRIKVMRIRNPAHDTAILKTKKACQAFMCVKIQPPVFSTTSRHGTGTTVAF